MYKCNAFSQLFCCISLCDDVCDKHKHYVGAKLMDLSIDENSPQTAK